MAVARIAVGSFVLRCGTCDDNDFERAHQISLKLEYEQVGTETRQRFILEFIQIRVTTSRRMFC